MSMNAIILVTALIFCVFCEYVTGNLIRWMDTYITNGLDGLPKDTPLHTRWFDLTDPILARLFPLPGDLLRYLKRSQRYLHEDEARENRER